MRLFTNSKYLCTILLFPIFLQLLAIIPLKDTHELELLIEGTKFNDSLVKSGMGNIIMITTLSFGEIDTVERKLEGDSTILMKGKTTKIFYAFEGERARYDAETVVNYSDSQSSVHKVESAYDGEKTMQFDYGLLERAHACIKPGNLVKDVANKVFWGMTINDEPIGEFLQRPEAQLIGKELINNDTCYVVETQKPGGVERYWINPVKGYRVQKIELRYNVLTITMIDLAQYLPNIWYWEKISSLLYKVNGGKKVLVGKRIIEMSDDFKVNVDVPDSLFNIKLPEGLKWYDTRIGKRVDQPD